MVVKDIKFYPERTILVTIPMKLIQTNDEIIFQTYPNYNLDIKSINSNLPIKFSVPENREKN